MVRYSVQDVRNVINLYRRYKSFRSVESITGISKSTVHRYWTRFHLLYLSSNTHSWKRKKKAWQHRCGKYKNFANDINSLFSNAGTVTLFSLKDIQKALSEKYENPPSFSIIAKCLKKNKISKRKFKKVKVTTHNQFELNKMIQGYLDVLRDIQDNSIISIDETSFCNHNVTDEGYFPIGCTPEQAIVRQRVLLSLIMAVQPGRIISHQLQKKAFNTDSFHSYLQETLDVLENVDQGREKMRYTLIIDNVAFHKSKRIQQLVETRGHKRV